MTIRIDVKPTPINLIQTYAPTSTANDEKIESFYKEIEDLVRNFPNREITIMMRGDMNAKLVNIYDEQL